MPRRARSWRRRGWLRSELGPGPSPRLRRPGRQIASITGVSRRAGKRDYVTDVGKACYVRYGTFESQAESGVGDGAVAAQVAVPSVSVQVQPRLGDAPVEHVEPFLALAAADDLADSGREHIHRGHGLPVVVHAHVERLDLL